MHLSIDAQTLEIRAIEVTDNSIGDAPMLPCLLEQIAEQEDLLSAADGAYDTKACHEATFSSEVRKHRIQQCKTPAVERG